MGQKLYKIVVILNERELSILLSDLRMAQAVCFNQGVCKEFLEEKAVVLQKITLGITFATKGAEKKATVEGDLKKELHNELGLILPE